MSSRSAQVIIRAHFLSGRYHAHPWGEAQHAMAGPEWPPSPWRLLRSLVAVWFDAKPHPVAESERDDLVQALGRSQPPALWLPAVSFSEIPYYQPIMQSKDIKRVLHFDHFAILQEGDEGACFCFDYEVDLSSQQRAVLSKLLARITYFGRGESRAILSLVESPPDQLHKVTPANDNSSSHHVRRRVLVSCGNFQASDLWGDEERCKRHLVQTTTLKGSTLPANTEWIDYSLPSTLIRSQLTSRPPPASEVHPRVAMVRFGLFRRIPIGLSEIVRVAREIRDQAAKYLEDNDQHSRRLIGLEADGSVSKGHQHAFWLPELDDGTGHINGCTAHIPDGEAGIKQCELDALLSVRHIFGDDEYPILVVAERIDETPPNFPSSRTWRPSTPFLAPLYKRHGNQDPRPAEQQLRRMVEETTNVAPKVFSVRGPGSVGKLSVVRTHLYRRGGWRWTKRTAAWFALEFDRPVVLPRPFGVDAHFGLGQFVPVASEATNREG